MIGTSGNDVLSASNGNDTIDALAGNDTVYANSGDATVFGGAGNDQLFGGWGRDVLYGGDGDDILDDFTGYNSTTDPQLLYGDAGNDTINGTAAADTMFGGADNDRLIGEGGDDSMSGDAGSDLMQGEAGNDTLFGGDGLDTLLGGTENDVLNGGAGSDSIDAGSGDDIVIKDDFGSLDTLLGGLGTDTLRLLPGDNRNLTVSLTAGTVVDAISGTQTFSGFENITTGGGNDTITGDAAANRLEGGAGNDVLNGAAGADVLIGGDGADTFILDQTTGTDTITGGEGGSDTDHITLSTNPAATGVTVAFTGNEAGTITVNGGAQIASFTQAEQVTLTAQNDILTASNSVSSPIVADGGAGADSMTGGGGNDSLTGGTGNDTLNGGSGSDTLDGGDGNDLIDGAASTPPATQFIRWSDIPDPQDGGQIDNLDVVPGTFNRTVGDTTLTVTTPSSLLTDFSTADIVIDGMPAGTNDFSSLRSVANNAQAGTYNFDFSTAVNNLNFTISELGAGLDYIDIVAFGPGGRIPIDIIQGSQIQVTSSGGFEQRISELVQNFSGPNDPTAAVRVVIPGPVTSLTLAHVSVSGQLSWIYISDFSFVPATPADDNAADSLLGGAGNDTLLGQGGNDTLDGGSGNDSLDGGTGADNLTGGSGADTLLGGDGDDRLLVGGADSAVGGGGDDLFQIDPTDTATNVAVTVAGGTDATVGAGFGTENGNAGDILDLSTISLPLTVIYSADGESGTVNGLDADAATDLTFTDIERVLTGAGADFINGRAATNGINIDTGGGDDTVQGGAGNDSVAGGTGNDELSGGEGNDTLDGGDGDDRIIEAGGPATTRSFNWTNTFDGTDPLNGATQTLLGGAPGAVNLTGDSNPDREFVFVQASSTGQEAVLAVSPALGASERVQSFTMSTVLDLASPGGSDHVDGISFSYGDPNTITGERENGVGTGLAVRLDPLANVIEVRWNGTVLQTVSSFNLETRGAGTLTVSVSSAGVVTVTAPLSPSPDITVTIPASSWSTVDQSGWQFAFAGRTGTNSGSIYIDDVNLNATVFTPATTGGNDSLRGGAGNDTIDGGLGNDTLSGGTGNDTLTGGGGNDSIAGDEGSDTLSGGAGVDTLAGGDGDDDIAFGGTDQAFGGGGDDVFVLDATDPATDLNATLDGGGDGTSGAGFGAENGNSGDVLDLSTVSSALTLIYGATGESGTVNGLDADVAVDLTFAEFERILTGIGADNVNGTAATGAIQVDTGAGNDTIASGSGDDSLSAGTGNDSLSGSAGNDTLDGGGGTDTVTYAASGAAVSVNLALGTGSGGDAQGDSLISIERVIGSAFDDALTGSGSADTLEGGTGNDTISGGAGNDTLTGGVGADRFVLQNGGGTDRITDFNLTRINGLATDRLDVSTLTAQGGSPLTWTDVQVTDTVGDGSGDAILTFPNGQSVILTGVSPSAVTSRGDLWAIGVPCFATGTPIRTPRGWRPVETLRPGDLVLTRTAGVQPVSWVASREVGRDDFTEQRALLPIRVRAGALGNDEDIRLSAQHCILMRLGGEEVLVRAIHLARHGYRGCRIAEGTRRVGYHHILLPQHAVLDAGGVAAESFYPGPQAIAMLSDEKRIELATVLGAAHGPARQGPRAKTLAELYGPHVRRVLTGKEAGNAIAAGLLRPAAPIVGPTPNDKARPNLRLVATAA